MYFRCATCHGSIWADGSEPETTAKPTCERCERTYDLTEALRDGASRKVGSRARKLARSEQIDLPGAYSVVLGLIPLELVREFGSNGSTVCRTSASSRATDTARTYDPEFEPAVAAGQLTPAQAHERGKRSTFAEGLVARHELSRDEAFDIADNKRSLLETIRSREGSRTETVIASAIDFDPDGASAAARAVGLATGGLVLLIVIGLVVSIGSDEPEPEVSLEAELGSEARELEARDARSKPEPASFSRKANTALAADVETDPDNGAIVRVSGPTPMAVLEAFCERSLFLEPIDVRHGVPADGGHRLGVIRDTRSLDRPAILQISRDAASGRWVAGDGRRTLAAEPAPDQLLQHVSR